MMKSKAIGWALISALAVMAPVAALANWQIYYSGKAARMFGSYGRGSFSSRSQCESYRSSRPGFESNNSYCSGYDPPRVNYAPAPPPRPSTGASSGPSSGGQVQQPNPAQLAEQRLQEEKAAKLREQVAAMEKEAGELRNREFEQGKGTLGGDLRNRFNASYGKGGAMGQLELSACWSRLAARADQAKAKEYADYAVAAREGRAVPACPEEAAKIPEPPAPTWVDDTQARMIEEEGCLKPLIANLQGRMETAKAASEKMRPEVEILEKKSQSTKDPSKKEEVDILLAEAKKALAEALEEDRKASEEFNKAQNELQALNDMKGRVGQGKVSP